MSVEFRSPLGLVLTGGGALGSWEAGALDGLFSGGLRFDTVLGYSSGALAGAGAFLGAMPELLSRWRKVDEGRILRFFPRLKPLSFFSSESLYESVQAAGDERNARKSPPFEFVVVTVLARQSRPAYHRFGASCWDGPLAARLVASASIPVIFPPVEIDGALYTDGGIPCAHPLSFAALSHCRDVLIVEMVRPEEAGRVFLNPLRSYEQQGREAALLQVETGMRSLGALPEPPRIFRLRPSRILEFSMLDFKSRYCAPALELGRRDAEAFLREGAVLPA